MPCLFGCLGALIGILVYFLVGGFIGTNLPVIETVEEQEIYALNDSTSIKGANYLFSGYINENMVFRYVINTDKGKHIEEVKADNTYVNEGDYTPIVKIHKTSLAKDWYYWFAYDVNDEGDYIEFFVPENTITNEYNIDLH